jgi:acyl-coenzyme A thioesterase PaaI-like protein
MSSSSPQIEHPTEFLRLADAVRELLAAMRTADAPPEVLRKAADMVEEAAALVAPHAVDSTPAQSALRFEHSDMSQFDSGDAALMFPYSPIVGPLNAISPPLTFTFDGERMVGGGTLPPPYTGPPGAVHGGIVALIFDELLGAVSSAHGHGGYTGTLTIRYEKPTPIDREIVVESRVDHIEGRKIFAEGTITHDGTVTARAQAIFIRPAQSSFNRGRTSGAGK